MSKKKNTLKDLDEFLKQQAATLVTPSKLSETANTLEPVKKPEDAPAPAETPAPRGEISVASIARDLKQLSVMRGEAFKDDLCAIILQAMNDQSTYSPEDKMLINTALYLRHGSNWKEAIRQYWKNKDA